MKNLFLLFISLGIVNFVFADEFEKNYGRGVVHIQFDSVSTVQFFSTPGATTASHHISILRNAWNIGTHYVSFDSIHFADSVPRWFSPIYYITRGEYARIDIIAVDSSNGYYRTILKDDQGRDVWVKKSKHIQFLSWFGFYSSVANIELASAEINLYDSPTERAHRVNHTNMLPPDGRYSMRPLEVKGFWMKVELQYPDPFPGLPWHIHTGWIQWRDEKQPLVKYNLMGC